MAELAICQDCNQPYLTSEGCTRLRLDGRERVPLPGDWGEPCRDCATPPGGIHHRGCCVEHCSVCGDQARFCGCGGEVPHGGRAHVSHGPGRA